MKTSSQNTDTTNAPQAGGGVTFDAYERSCPGFAAWPLAGSAAAAADKAPRPLLSSSKNSRSTRRGSVPNPGVACEQLGRLNPGAKRSQRDGLGGILKTQEGVPPAQHPLPCLFHGRCAACLGNSGVCQQEFKLSGDRHLVAGVPPSSLCFAVPAPRCSSPE